VNPEPFEVQESIYFKCASVSFGKGVMSCQRSDHDALHSIGLNFHDRLSSTDFYSCSSPSLSPNRWGDDIEERDDCQAPIWHSRSYAATLAVCTRHRSGSAAVEIKSAPRHGSAQSKEMNFDTVLRKAISESSIDDFSILRFVGKSNALSTLL